MTIIIGFKKDNQVWIACDRYITYGDLIVDPKLDSKLVHMANAVIGGCGDLTIRNHLELYISKGNNYEIVLSSKNDVMQFFINFKKYLTKTAGLGEAEHNQVQEFHNSGFMVATSDRLFLVDEDCGVIEFDRFCCAGRGEEMGLALLEYFYTFKKSTKPETMVKRIMKVIYKYQNSCGGQPTLVNVTQEIIDRRNL
jgi:ATP-dependent protease HslVU (ClpYQ) peptidase subunit